MRDCAIKKVLPIIDIIDGISFSPSDRKNDRHDVAGGGSSDEW
jgi:hypothetical protein